MESIIVYDILSDSIYIPWKMIFLIGLYILFVLFRWRKMKSIWQAILVAFCPGLVILGWYYAIFYHDYLDRFQRGKDAYLDGKYAIVEGVVSGYFEDSWPKKGPREHFYVGERIFYIYNDKVGFNTKRGSGSPIRNGVRVKIWHNGNDIYRIEFTAIPQD